MIYEIWHDNICITDGYDKEKAIQDATDYLENNLAEEGVYGEFDEDIVILSEKGRQEMTITLISERDDYDGGRSDYYGGVL